MRGRTLWKLGLQNIAAAPLRTVLTILGMAIGIAAILAVLALGSAGQIQVRNEMRRLGIDKVWISAAEGTVLSSAEAMQLAQRFGVQASEMVCFPAEITSRYAAKQAAVIGCTDSYLSMSGIKVLKGRTLYPLEWKEQGRGVLLGHKLAKMLKVGLGDIVELLGMPMYVRGVLDTAQSFVKVDIAESAIVPLKALSSWWGDEIHEIVLQVPSEIAPQELAEQTKQWMKSSGKEQIETLTLQMQMEAADSVITTFVDVLKWVAVICILVGGMGVMNILLVSVRERRREIGIMKSLGTTRGQICALFLLEAFMYATAGGIIGIVLGQLLTVTAGKSIGIAAAADARDCLIVLMAAMMIGLFFGVLPASRAADLNCVDALRDE